MATPIIRAGRLRHVVHIESLQGDAAKAARGQTKKTWKEFYSDVRCDIRPLSGRELEIARQLVPTASHQVTMRYHSGVTEKMRLTGRYLGTRILNIDAYQDVDERGRKIILTCTEQKGG